MNITNHSNWIYCSNIKLFLLFVNIWSVKLLNNVWRLSMHLRKNTMLILTKIIGYITDLLTPWSKVLLEKLTGSQLIKKFSPILRNSKSYYCIHDLSLLWARSVQFMPVHITSWKSFLLVSSHLDLSHPSGLFLSGFPTKTLYAILLSPIRTFCFAHLILLRTE
jgi:hypothetical protein